MVKRKRQNKTFYDDVFAAPQTWWPSAEKFAEFYEKFPEPETR